MIGFLVAHPFRVFQRMNPCRSQRWRFRSITLATLMPTQMFLGNPHCPSLFVQMRFSAMTILTHARGVVRVSLIRWGGMSKVHYLLMLVLHRQIRHRRLNCLLRHYRRCQRTDASTVLCRTLLSILWSNRRVLIRFRGRERRHVTLLVSFFWLCRPHLQTPTPAMPPCTRIRNIS